MSLFQKTITTSIYQLNGKDVKIHAITTGLISVKNNFLERKGKGLFTKINIMLGQQHAAFMPIWVWVIEHPEGIIVIDTGDIEEAAHKEFHKHESLGSKFLLWAMALQRKITKEDELNNQLAKINIKPEQVSKIILTHLHADHTDGLKFFPTNEIIVNELEYKHPYENLPTTYPTWFKPTLVNFSKNRVDSFDNAYPITKSEDLWLVSTPGHTHHHCSVLFKTDNEHILFAGDTSYKQQQLLANSFAGSNIDYKKTQETYTIIKQYAAKYPTVYLPSHDKDSGERLLNKEPVIIK
ncbi:MAG: N-acyl homoserine lactonase family protein [Chitinophagaceae bacterium]